MTYFQADWKLLVIIHMAGSVTWSKGNFVEIAYARGKFFHNLPVESNTFFMSQFFL